MIKVIIFDLDGTVADTIYAIREGVNLTMSALGYPEHTYEEVLGFVNFGARHLIEEALPASVRGDQTVVDQTLALYDRMYAQTYLHTDRCYDGIPEALEILHRDFRLAMLSNKQDAMVQGWYASCSVPDCSPSHTACATDYPPSRTKPSLCNIAKSWVSHRWNAPLWATAMWTLPPPKTPACWRSMSHGDTGAKRFCAKRVRICLRTRRANW